MTARFCGVVVADAYRQPATGGIAPRGSYAPRNLTDEPLYDTQELFLGAEMFAALSVRA